MRNQFYATMLFLAPLCYAASSFFWHTTGQYTEYTVTSGTLLIVGSVFWVFAFAALFDLLKDKAPRYAVWGFFIAVYGCLCGGAGFALRDIFTLTFHIPHKQMLETFADYPVFDNVVFWIGGPAFPVSLLVVGIVLTAKKKAPTWIGIMIALSGVLFPASRITRTEMIAHAADLCMLLPMAYLGWRMMRQNGVKSGSNKTLNVV